MLLAGAVDVLSWDFKAFSSADAEGSAEAVFSSAGLLAGTKYREQLANEFPSRPTEGACR